MGSSHGSYSKVQVITVQPTIAWKINDKVSVGFGPTFNRIDGQLKNTLATNGLLGSNGDTKINIKGDDTAIGYNVGVMVDLTDDTTWGLTYHQGQVPPGRQHRSEERSGCPGPERQVRRQAGHHPAGIGGYLHHPQVRRQVDGLPGRRLDPLEPPGEDRSAQQRRTGARPGPGLQHHRRRPELARHLVLLGRYLLPGHPGAVLRTGFAYEPSPTSNEDRNVRIPVGDRKSSPSVPAGRRTRT